MPSNAESREETFLRFHPRAELSDELRDQSPARLYAQIRSAIRHKLVGVDERLEESLLSRTYSTSRNSVRAALSLLATEGIVARERRSGTVIIEDIEDIRIDTGTGMAPSQLVHHTVKVIDATMRPITPLLREMLQTESENIWVDQVMDYKDGLPFAIYIRYSDTESRPLNDESRHGAFDRLFEEAYGSELQRIDCSVQAVSSDERIARLLGVPTGTTLLLKDRLLWDSTGVPREFSHTYYIANRTAVTTKTWVGSADSNRADTTGLF